MPSFNCFNCQELTSYMAGRGLCEECVRAVQAAQRAAGPDFASQNYAAQTALAGRHRESAQTIMDPMRQ